MGSNREAGPLTGWMGVTCGQSQSRRYWEDEGGQRGPPTLGLEVRVRLRWGAGISLAAGVKAGQQLGFKVRI